MLENLLLAQVSDPEANAWANAVQGAGGFVTGPQRRRVATLIRSLKAGGVWPLLDRLWLFAAENPTQALIDLKGRATATLAHISTTDPAFVAKTGFLGNRNGYINSGFNPATAGGNYTQNSASFGVWVETVNTTPGSSDCLMGNDESNYGHIQTGASTYTYGINSGSAAGTTIAVASTGLIGVNRLLASGAGAINDYLNGALKESTTIASVAIANRNFNILASNNAGAAYQPADARLSCAYIGGGLSVAQNAALYTALRTYMSAMGVA